MVRAQGRTTIMSRRWRRWFPMLLLLAPCAIGAASDDRLDLRLPASLVETGAPAILPPEVVQYRTRWLMAGSLLGVAAYGARLGWADDLTGDFGTESEGWFGQHTYAGGADKLGHAFAGYAGTRLLGAALEWAGNAPADAQRLGALTTFGVLLGVEVLDGFEEGHQFSHEDLVADAVGVGLGLLMEQRPALDALLDFRWQYWPADARRRVDDAGEADGDYDGATYLAVLKASGVPRLAQSRWLRYLELSVGYGTVGYESDESGLVRPGTRLFYYGVSLNLAEVLNATAWRGAPADALGRRASDALLEYVQVPGTAWLSDHALPR